MTQRQYQNDIVKKMEVLKIYKPEYEYAIKTLARSLYDLEKMLKQFDESGGQIMVRHTNKFGATNIVKNPFYLAIETLRQDILAYSRELGLTPAALKKINESEVKDKKSNNLLAEALKGLK